LMITILGPWKGSFSYLLFLLAQAGYQYLTPLYGSESCPVRMWGFSSSEDCVTWVSTLWNQVTISAPPHTRSCISFETQDCCGDE
jgi:hypothetical protein